MKKIIFFPGKKVTMQIHMREVTFSFGRLILETFCVVGISSSIPDENFDDEIDVDLKRFPISEMKYRDGYSKWLINPFTIQLIDRQDYKYKVTFSIAYSNLEKIIKFIYKFQEIRKKESIIYFGNPMWIYNLDFFLKHQRLWKYLDASNSSRCDGKLIRGEHLMLEFCNNNLSHIFKNIGNECLFVLIGDIYSREVLNKMSIIGGTKFIDPLELRNAYSDISGKVCEYYSLGLLKEEIMEIDYCHNIIFEEAKEGNLATLLLRAVLREHSFLLLRRMMRK